MEEGREEEDEECRGEDKKGNRVGVKEELREG